ncbi:MAG: rod shape-determining protein [Candidatus Pacebacteria bacterium]|nr:rod shape-determining protein [Candidatus Paceibacterota bacterium]
MFVKKVGIDLGTANTVIYIPGKGIVINEPTTVAVSLDDNQIMAIGNEAKEMLGRTPNLIEVYKPLKEGVIADYKVTKAMLKYFLNKALGSFRLIKPDVVISAPCGITSTERRAVLDAANEAGANNVFVVKEPVLAALGAGVPINSAAGNMVVNIGGGTTEIAVISLGGIVASDSVRVAGNKMDEAIIEYIKKKYNMIIGERTAESIKIEIGTAIAVKSKKEIEITGGDISEGLPKNVKINSNEVAEALINVLKEIVMAIKGVLSNTPPELVADIMSRGIFLAGGGGGLRNLDELITRLTGVPVYVADDPIFCVAKGTGIFLENIDIYKRSLLSSQ